MPLPPVDAFWSLTAYTTPDLNLVPTPANRYSVGDRTTGLKRDASGGVTIYLQARSPGPDKESNWLRCPTGGAWFVILRMYRPHQEFDEATWQCPGLRRVG